MTVFVESGPKAAVLPLGMVTLQGPGVTVPETPKGALLWAWAVANVANSAPVKRIFLNMV